MTDWRVAKSLLVLRDEINQAWPSRSKVSDGTIGDEAHRNAPGGSDHNPNAYGVVTAFDITHDPKNGFDAHVLAGRLLQNRHRNLKYVISNGRIAGYWTNYKWTNYSGADPHDTHIHVSVGVGEDGQSLPPYDDKDPWNVTGEDMRLTAEDVQAFILATLYRDATKQDLKDFTGKTLAELRDAVDRTGERKKINEKVWANEKGAVAKLEKIKELIN